ncbi:hypothetical protein TrST_g361 [Triparma strigata]|uniref:Uncharacterized protein n=1 Tax=Triparma strigata TaxID=1606541 RepID=A0A9W7E0P5_9STRA|nr:hypothetical protein TrST_g361 [Triparma strigata]
MVDFNFSQFIKYDGKLCLLIESCVILLMFLIIHFRASRRRRAHDTLVVSLALDQLSVDDFSTRNHKLPGSQYYADEMSASPSMSPSMSTFRSLMSNPNVFGTQRQRQRQNEIWRKKSRAHMFTNNRAGRKNPPTQSRIKAQPATLALTPCIEVTQVGKRDSIKYCKSF